jgi:hypothetical protein
MQKGATPKRVSGAADIFWARREYMRDCHRTVERYSVYALHVTFCDGWLCMTAAQAAVFIFNLHGGYRK